VIAHQRMLATRLEAGAEIASFSLGGRDTRVVRVGHAFTKYPEFVAQFVDSGEVLGVPEPTLERAAERARIAAMPEEADDEDDACCAAGCSRCTGQMGMVL
jgi:hypothetical protein